MNQTIEALFAKAYQLQHDGQLPEAIRLYEQLLEQSPNHLDALRFSGLAYAQLNDMPNAILLLNRALLLQPMDANLHNNLANAYKKSNELDKAIYHYQQAIQLTPNYAQAYNNLASIYAMQNDYQQALRYYRLAVHAEPDFVPAHYHLGLLLLKNNQLAAAETQFNNVLALCPDHLDALFYMGILHLNANQFDESEQAFQSVLAINNEHVQSLVNLGVIALKRDQGQVALNYFSKALSFDQYNLEARNNLAATFIHHDRFENALTHYQVLLQHDPFHIEYLYNAGVAEMALGHLQEATKHFKTILTSQPDHFAAITNLAAVYLRLGNREKAIVLLNRAQALNPKDTASQFMLNALTGSDKTPATCPDYVSNLFNNYAIHYDQHMQGSLKYTIPFQIVRLLHQLGYVKVKHTLDIGCGTGLSGVVLQDLSEHLTGIDISAKMLAIAKEKDVYDELIEAELLTFLKQDQHNYELVVAADVLPYIGDLQPLYQAIKQRLSVDGVFVFTCEISSDEPWKLQDSARFCHHPDYILSLCVENKLELIHQEKIVARQQESQDLHVMLYCVRA